MRKTVSHPLLFLLKLLFSIIPNAKSHSTKRYVEEEWEELILHSRTCFDQRKGSEMDDSDAEGAKEEIETVKALIMEERYKDTSKSIQMAMEAYPTQDLLKEDGFGISIISETLLYGDIYLSKCGDFDYYSVLHISHYSTKAEVIKQCDQLRKELIHLKSIQFPGAAAADSKLLFAKTNLCCQPTRLSFDSNRNDCVFLDWPREWFNNKTTSSSRESYLNWRPPIYCVDATMDVESWRKLQLGLLSVPHQEEKEKEEEEEEKDPSLSPEVKILKRKVFDDMPQNPNYTPLLKYSRKVVKK